MQDSPVISAQNISKSYTVKGEEFNVLNDISIDVNEEEYVSILGPTGCGKSTLLKILGGIIPASAGNITLEGETFEKQLPNRVLTNFGFVFQDDNLLPWRTAEKNLSFVLEILKKKDKHSNQRIDEVLEMVGLLNYKTEYPHELSGGMRQRVSIARALVHNPKVLLMDQPLGALDAITRKMLAFELLNIRKKTKKTIIMVTNNTDEALLLSSKILVLSHCPGEIVEKIDDDIPLEERNIEITLNKRFNELREMINEIIRGQSQNCKV